MKLLRGRREEPGNEANVRRVCALSSSSHRDNAECSSDDGFSKQRRSSQVLSIVYRLLVGLLTHKAAFCQAMT